MKRFRRIQPVQMHHPNLRRPKSSRQSAYHHPLKHEALHNRQIPDTKREEQWSAPYYILWCSLELLLRHGHLSVFSVRSTLDVAILRKCPASYTLGASSVSTKHYTDMSMLLDYVIQHGIDGIDGAHSQSCTLPIRWVTITRCKSPSTVTMEYICFPSTNGVWLLSSGAKSRSTVTLEYMFPFRQLCVL